LWDKEWSKIYKLERKEGDAVVIQVCSQTIDGIVRVCAWMTDKSASVLINDLDAFLDDGSLHFSLWIDNFPFVSTNSLLALKVHMDVESEIMSLQPTLLDVSQEGLDLSATGDKTMMFASWDRTVRATSDSCNGRSPVRRSEIKLFESPADEDNLSLETTRDSVAGPLVRRFAYFSFLTSKNCPEPSLMWSGDIGATFSARNVVAPQEDSELANDSGVSTVVPSIALALFTLLWASLFWL